MNTCEGVTNRVDKQRAWGEVNKREYKINKAGLKQSHLKHLHVSKEVPTKHNYGKKTMPDLFWESGMPECGIITKIIKNTAFFTH